MTHYHIAYGLNSYGPDGSEGFPTATEVTGLGALDDQLSEELQRASESASDLAASYGEGADGYQRAGNAMAELNELRAYRLEIERASSLAVLSATFAPSRADAPVYKDNPQAWRETVLRLVGERFPLAVSTTTKLYVWECENGDECEHLSED